ncbi:hypothetical protein ACWF94_22930 [Streptomyces sp. NPDC055078]
MTDTTDLRRRAAASQARFQQVEPPQPALRRRPGPPPDWPDLVILPRPMTGALAAIHDATVTEAGT